MTKIDVSKALDDLERVLRSGDDRARCLDALGTLQRWQWDDQLDEASRKRAARVLSAFRSIYSW